MAEVLPVHVSDGQLNNYSNSPLRRSSHSQTSFFLGNNSSSYSSSRRSNFGSLPSSAPSSPRASSTNLSSYASYQSTPASTLSLETSLDEEEDEDGEFSFPGYSSTAPNEPHKGLNPPSSPVTVYTELTLNSDDEVGDDDPISPTTTSPEPLPKSEDDTAIKHEPSQHVDYLSHDWQEEDIWSSWRHIVGKRKIYGERSRLENASWRTWAKSKYKLRTVSPETLNWLKDCDVTWLYGPLQTASNRSYSQHASEPISRLSKSNSFLNKKPILKKRSVSEVMLQRSISASSLVKQAAAAVQAQQENSKSSRNRPTMERAVSDFVTSSIPSRTISRDTTDYSTSSRSTSGLQTPDHGERKHIRFDDKVEQCIAVDLKDGEYDDDDDERQNWALRDDDSSSDDGVVMMKKSKKKKQLSRTNSRNSFSSDSKTIAKLPSTTLKYRTDSPDMPDQPPTHSLGYWRSSRLSPSPSQETLRPSNPSTNFLLADDDEEDDDISWEPSGAFKDGQESAMGRSSPETEAESGEASVGLRRTASGMFMPYDEADDEPVAPGIIGRVVDTVNTARDIAHVIWNVGWRS
ncbi:uncharacterized protein BDZ99DRAFT_390397 [Mytilinidion resinicola]|uniref:Nitrogen regulatory protein areA GATA-like domain-containing protein n=1 Tax=Mytilinidion resinicola TaxID=574789 RepID=A0A6A6YJA4_9PEZI|nr:uncharacterized protein BDZ99DRAFT_390397 [Mytilinidion resinicola]KAF2808603.1 hypothetical protein BDZ99DRAFT_390397 [Mytilinidion resinicola]